MSFTLIAQQHVSLIVQEMLLGTYGQVSSHDSPISNPNTAIVLYYDWRERRHANVKVVRWRAALLQRGEQAIDKERDIWDARSDAHVLNSGPA